MLLFLSQIAFVLISFCLYLYFKVVSVAAIIIQMYNVQ